MAFMYDVETARENYKKNNGKSPEIEKPPQILRPYPGGTVGTGGCCTLLLTAAYCCILTLRCPSQTRVHTQTPIL